MHCIVFVYLKMLLFIFSVVFLVALNENLETFHCNTQHVTRM